ncbi:ABC transporter permease subunit [Arthrobacter sp. 147(2020)]|uniref:ABC transporter permease subunit n=1 Tax=unclassified Arthrobacter TaxID=235627 RepID=UPI001492FF35|nr:ABC transporter permease [Arthrobacter sp. AET 35A]NOJ62896.1 ABC transporter permease [Arthrobacter sp. 147(2020)]
MSVATETRPEGPTHTARVRNWKAPIGFGIGALVALLVFALGSPAQTAVFRISNDSDRFRLADVALPATTVGWFTAVALTLIAVYAFLQVRNGRKVARWIPIVYGALFMIGFLTWVVGSANTPSISLAGLIAGSVTLAIPLIFGSLSGVLCERVGVVNIAIEGQLLSGAFAAAVAASISGNAYVGLIAAAFAGTLVSVVLAVFSIKYYVNQIIVGVVLNVLVSGLTGFLASTLLSRDSATFNSPPSLPVISIPFLSDLPIIGGILFRQSIVGYLMYVAVIVIYVGLFHTKWGLRVRAVGEHPQAADTMGIKVNSTRFWNVLLGGAVAGFGGAFFTLVSVSSFSRDMTAGAGYIALAALIFGRWNPIGAFFAALLFGFFTNLQYVLSIVGTSVPSQFMAMLPYIVTILAVAGLVGRSRPPAASGTPYMKE